VCSGLAHRTVRCATGQCPVHQDRTESNKPLSGFSRRTPLKITGLSGVSAEQRILRATVDCKSTWREEQGAAESEVHRTVNSTSPVRHRTIRCHMRTKPPTVDQLLTLTVGWRGGAPDSVRCAHRQQPSPTATRWLVAINTTPTGHFKVCEPKQHSNSYSWHIQALPTTSIHWSISYTRFRPPHAIQVPQKRDQAKESYSCEFSNSVLWDSLRESVYYILWSFERGVLTPIHCKASKSPLSLWLALRRLQSFVDKEEETLVGLGDQWREGKGWKRPVLSGLLNGD
jgi:hypothetical protein